MPQIGLPLQGEIKIWGRVSEGVALGYYGPAFQAGHGCCPRAVNGCCQEVGPRGNAGRWTSRTHLQKPAQASNCVEMSFDRTSLATAVKGLAARNIFIGTSSWKYDG